MYKITRDPGFVCLLRIARTSMTDCTNGGVSQIGAETLALIKGDTMTTAQLIRAQRESPFPVVVVKTNAYGDPIIVPTTDPRIDWNRMLGPMFGGNYATGDSRLSAEIERVTGRSFYGAVCIHDRFETPAQYRALTAGD